MLLNCPRATLAAFPLLGLALAVNPTLVHAQAAQLEEVMVTAQKREQGLQDVPIALSAFSDDFIENIGAELIGDVARFTPSLSMNSSTQGEPNIYIRGVGSDDFGVGGDTSVGVFIDDVYVGRIHGALSDLSDVERVEVLKGPQGTLFGRNTIGGAISITTKKPSGEDGGRLKLEAGSYDKLRVDGAYETALNDQWAMRVSGSINRRDGWKHNDFDDSDVENLDNSSLRLTTVYRPSDTVEAMFKVGYDNVDVTGPGVQSTNPVYANGDAFDDINSDLGDRGLEQRELIDLSMHWTWDLGDYELKSITAFRETHYSSRKDATGAGVRERRLRTNIDVDAEQYSQEFRLNYDAGGDFFWFAGVSAFYEDILQGSLLESTNETVKALIAVQAPDLIDRLVPFFPDGEDYHEELFNGGEYTSYAAYGDATWQFAEAWELIVGLRYSYDQKDHYVDSLGPEPDILLGGIVNFPGLVYKDFPRSDNEESWDAWTPRAVLRWSNEENTMWYGSVSRGFKSGGFNSFVPDNPFDPEYVMSYELGHKSHWLEQRLQLNMALFYYDYEDLQVNNIENNIVVVRNAGEASGQGVEVEVQWLIAENWRLQVAGSYLDSQFDEFIVDIGGTVQDIGGETTPLAPEFQFSAVLFHTQPLSGDKGLIDYQLSYAWSDEYYFEVGNTKENPDEYQDAFGLLDARVAWTDHSDQWTLALFGSNLTDEDYLVHAGGLTKYDLNTPLAISAIGRTFGGSIEYRF